MTLLQTSTRSLIVGLAIVLGFVSWTANCDSNVSIPG